MNARRGIVWLGAACAALVIGLSLAKQAPAEEIRSSFGIGELIVTADEGFTAGTIQKLTYAFPWCQTHPGEVSCTWNLKAALVSHPSRRCSPGTPHEVLIWESGAQSGPGTVESGVRSFPLEGCPGQTLIVSYDYEKSYEPLVGSEGAGGISKGSSIVTSVTFGWAPLRGIEEPPVEASPPPAASAPPPLLALRFARNCRSLAIDGRRYSFAFKQLRCGKAKNLARMFFASRGGPGGYRCLRRPSGRVRCWRKGRAAKFVEWRPPRAGRARTA